MTTTLTAPPAAALTAPPAAAVTAAPQRASGALHTITPYLMVRDADGAIAFCKAAFGAVEVMRHVEADGPVRVRIAHAQLRIGDALLMLSQENPAYPELPGIETCRVSPVSLFLEVDDADATVARAVQAGATPTEQVADRPYGRSGTVRDPFGLLWHVTSQVRAAGPGRA